MRQLATILAIAFLALGSGAALANPTAEDLADRMLAKLGGRAAWAAVTATTNDSQQNRVQEPTAVRAVIWLDFTQRRFHIETKGPGFHSARAVQGDKGWRKTRDGKIEDIPADILAEDLAWYGGHVYRSIHRIAVNDPDLTYRLGSDGRLEVLEKGKRMIWFKLDATGEPYNFGAFDNDIGTLCGPWEFERGGIKHPLWVSNPDGTWRANIKALGINTPFDPKAFERPAP